MAFSLDHIVIAVQNLEEAIASYEKLGFTVLRGGEHPRRGSVNALIVFQDGVYFELIAFPKPVPDFRWWQVLQKAGPGFVDFAILPRNMEKDLANAKARGFGSGPVEPGGRLTPQGVRSEWQTARAPTSDVPFLTGDLTPRTYRVPEGEVRNHKNGVLGVAKITVAVSDLAKSSERYRALFPDSAIKTDEKGVGRFLCEPGVIELVQPNAGAPEANGIAVHLEKRGEGPYSVSLRTSGEARTLDSVGAQGVKLRLVNAANPYL
jgi:catechol 2,3-dioxygenase-like lactoylglutathione lyase family enzyme